MTMTPLVIAIVWIWELIVTASAKALAHTNRCFITVSFGLAAFSGGLRLVPERAEPGTCREAARLLCNHDWGFPSANVEAGPKMTLGIPHLGYALVTGLFQASRDKLGSIGKGWVDRDPLVVTIKVLTGRRKDGLLRRKATRIKLRSSDALIDSGMS